MSNLYLNPRDVALLAAMHITTDPPVTDWHARYCERAAVIDALEVELERHQRRWRRALVIAGVQMGLIVGVVVGVVWRWM